MAFRLAPPYGGLLVELFSLRQQRFRPSDSDTMIYRALEANDLKNVQKNYFYHKDIQDKISDLAKRLIKHLGLNTSSPPIGAARRNAASLNLKYDSIAALCYILNNNFSKSNHFNYVVRITKRLGHLSRNMSAQICGLLASVVFEKIENRHLCNV